MSPKDLFCSYQILYLHTTWFVQKVFDRIQRTSVTFKKDDWRHDCKLIHLKIISIEF
jgi:hypothetical protein